MFVLNSYETCSVLHCRALYGTVEPAWYITGLNRPQASIITDDNNNTNKI